VAVIGDRRVRCALAGRSSTAASCRTPSATTSSTWWVGFLFLPLMDSRIDVSAAAAEAFRGGEDYRVVCFSFLLGSGERQHGEVDGGG